MPPPPYCHWLMFSAVVALALAQDGYNIYKDIQRGKVEELERYITDEIHHIDPSAQTLPSVGARVQIPNSDKRTMNRFKNLKIPKYTEEEDSEEEEPQFNTSEEDGEELTATRVLIPRTHVLLREEPMKLKRAPLLWGIQLATSAQAAKQAVNRGIFWSVKAEKLFPYSFRSRSLFPLDRCKLLKSQFTEYYQCD